MNHEGTKGTKEELGVRSERIRKGDALLPQRASCWLEFALAEPVAPWEEHSPRRVATGAQYAGWEIRTGVRR